MHSLEPLAVAAAVFRPAAVVPAQRLVRLAVPVVHVGVQSAAAPQTARPIDGDRLACPARPGSAPPSLPAVLVHVKVPLELQVHVDVATVAVAEDAVVLVAAN